MLYLIGIFIFIFGAIIGSFLNVVALRYNTGMTLGGRSGCFSCGNELVWYELIPVFSYLFLRGKCRSCKSKISPQYPLIEALTGLVFLLVFLKEMGNLWAVAFYWIIFSILTVILIYDLKHKIIPDGLVYTFCGLSLLGLFVHFGSVGISLASFSGTDFGWSLAAGPILFLPFFILWAVSKGRWIGLGDGKLALGVGWLLGATYGGTAIIFAFWIGALVSVILLAFRGKFYSMKSEIPFAPFIIFSLFLVYYVHMTVFDFITSIQNVFFH